MKVVVQIPAHDEHATIADVVRSIPREIAGVDEVEVIVVDDGSADGTADAAERAGADQVVRFPGRRGLAAAHQAGLDAALAAGADAIVTTDADGQYDGAEIPLLLAPILESRADVVIGDRSPARLAHFSGPKRLLQRLGSAAVRLATGAAVPDATSGFRALTREAALSLHVLTDFSYTVETIAAAASRRLRVASVPVTARPVERPSRLATGTLDYVLRQGGTLLRVTARYRALELFLSLGMAAFFAGFALGVRFLIYFFRGDGDGHVQSVVLSATLLLGGLFLALAGLLIDLVATNRRLSEEVLARLKRLETRDPAGTPPHRREGP